MYVCYWLAGWLAEVIHSMLLSGICYLLQKNCSCLYCSSFVFFSWLPSIVWNYLLWLVTIPVRLEFPQRTISVPSEQSQITSQITKRNCWNTKRRKQEAKAQTSKRREESTTQQQHQHQHQHNTYIHKANSTGADIHIHIILRYLNRYYLVRTVQSSPVQSSPV